MLGKTISHYRPQSREKPNAWLVLLTALLAVMLFLVDLSIPLGVAGGVPYVAVVLLSLWLPGKRYTILVATLCTGFTILGLYWSAPGGEIWKALANRFLAVFAIWVTATLSLQRKRAEEALRKAEKQLLHAQKMEALGNLTGGIAHDFRNLLMGVMGCCRLAEDTLASSGPARSYIEEIITLAETGAVFTRQLLTFSHKREVQLKPMMINSVISATEGLLRRLLEEDIVLRVILSRSGGAMVADRGHVEQILMNLAVNARDAMPRGGELTIKTADVDLEEGNERWHGNEKSGPYVMLEVSDTGCGMDEEIQARIFEPFFTTKEDEGTGLGLSNVYGIVKQLGGDINVDSTLGGGTTFSLLFPRSARPLAAAEAAKDEEAPPGGTETVLVVEDNRLVRMTVRIYLEDLGYKALEASGPAEGLRVCKEHSGPIELLVTDMVLPQMSGRELARQVQAQTPSVKILYMSAYPADFLEEQGRLKVSDPSLEKPFTKSALATKVREVLDEHLG